MQKRQTHQHVEQLVEVPVPMTQEEVVHVPEIITQTRVQQEHVEQMIEVPIPMQQEEVVHVPEIVMQPRIVHQPVEQIVEARLGILLTFSEAFVSCKSQHISLAGVEHNHRDLASYCIPLPGARPHDAGGAGPGAQDHYTDPHPSPAGGADR